MKYNKFSKKQLIDYYKTLILSRFLDDKQLVLLKQGKGFFHIGCSGHEAVQIASALNFDSSTDYAYPYYRDQAFCLQWGMEAKELLLSFFAKKDDPNSSGRQMPQHYGHKKLNIVSNSSPTGTQFLQAVGAAFVLKREKDKGVVYVSAGEGTASQGDFHEALNWGSREKAPVIFHIQNNGYAISVPVENQISGSSIYKMSSGYDSLARFHIDGTDFFESYNAFQKATDYARKRKGPVLIESKVVRLLPHSSSDDHTKYRQKKDLLRDIDNDPIIKIEKYLINKKICNNDDLIKIRNSIKETVNNDSDWAETQPDPEPDTFNHHIFDSSNGYIENDSYTAINDKIVMVDAINHALHEEMKLNDKMVIYGQDIEDGKGGVFTATKGLSSKFGSNRVFNSPLAESSIIGTAIGMATLGYKPVVEIQFGDYIWTGMMQIRNELATMRYRSNGDWLCPVVIRVPVGGYIHGALCHSQSIEGYFAHLPGILIAYPSNAKDAKGLLKMACRLNDPVLFLEHKGLYRQPYASSEEPDENYLLPFGKGKIVHKGEDLTVIAWGAVINKCLDAIKSVDANIEIIDLRTLVPLDFNLIEKSIKKTNRVVIVHEDNITNGFGAELSAQITEKLFEHLDAPVKRIASEDCPVAYSQILEDEILVQTKWILSGIIETLEF